MKSKLFVVLIVLFMFPAGMLAQAEDAHPSSDNHNPLKISITGGSTSFQLDNLKDFYRGFLEEYRDAGIPMRDQVEYPANGIFGMSAQISLNKLFHVGLSVHTSKSAAYSLYGDILGTVDLTSEVNALFADMFIKAVVWNHDFFQLYLGLNNGFVLGEFFIDQEFSVPGILEPNMHAEFTAEGNGYAFQPFVELSRQWHQLSVFGQFGYRRSEISTITATYKYGSYTETAEDVEFEVDLSGIVLAAGIGFSF